MLAALSGQDVDYVPMHIIWNVNPLHEKLSWNNDREKLQLCRDRGWDTYLTVFPTMTPAADVQINKSIEKTSAGQILKQTWKTPAGDIHEQLSATDDWEELHGRCLSQSAVINWEKRKDTDVLYGPDGIPRYLQFVSDYRTPRYVEFPFKDLKDLESLDYLFPLDNPADTAKIVQEYQEKRKLADEFNVPLFTYLDAGMDWLIWLYPADEAVLRVVDDPEYVRKLLGHINQAKCNRLKLLLDLGIDGIQRRGWYESVDFWSPQIFREFAKPELETEIEMAHRAGKPFCYIMVTGIMPLLPELASLPFDCLLGPDPVVGGQDFRQIREALPGKTIWGGFSGTGHFINGTPEDAARAVADAIAICGKERFILGMEVSFRSYFKWENFVAAEQAWKMLR